MALGSELTVTTQWPLHESIVLLHADKSALSSSMLEIVASEAPSTTVCVIVSRSFNAWRLLLPFGCCRRSRKVSLKTSTMLTVSCCWAPDANMVRHDLCRRPESESCGSPNIVSYLPLPLWPYARMTPFCPADAPFTTNSPQVLYISVTSDPGGKTRSKLKAKVWSGRLVNVVSTPRPSAVKLARKLSLPATDPRTSALLLNKAKTLKDIPAILELTEWEVVQSSTKPSVRHRSAADRAIFSLALLVKNFELSDGPAPSSSIVPQVLEVRTEMGAGGEASSQRRKDFVYRDQAEPHATRKTEILKKYPEIKQLMGHEPLTKYIVAATVALQVGMAVMTLSWSWPAYLAAVYVVGATANHSLFLAIHELSHNLGFKSPEHNKICGIFANLPIAIPYSITFKPYHMEHHRYQGDEGVDTDIPTEWEANLITTSSKSKVEHTIKKLVFMFCQIFAYAFRPMLVKPSLVPKDGWIVLNWIAVVRFARFCCFVPAVYFAPHGNFCSEYTWTIHVCPSHTRCVRACVYKFSFDSLNANMQILHLIRNVARWLAAHLRPRHDLHVRYQGYLVLPSLVLHGRQHSPHGWSFHRRALRGRWQGRDILVLRPSEHAGVQCWLSQRAPRLSQHRLEQLAQGKWIFFCALETTCRRGGWLTTNQRNASHDGTARFLETGALTLQANNLSWMPLCTCGVFCLRLWT